MQFDKKYVILNTILFGGNLTKGGHQMNHCELILNLVDKYIAEREKNIILQQQLKNQQEEKQVKTNIKQ